jgi:hypothetical protein
MWQAGAFMRWLPASLSLALLCGCSSQKHHKTLRLFEPFMCDGPVFVFCGHLQTNWVEGYLGAADYQMKTVSAGGGVVVTFHVVFYRSTLPKVLPTDALLAMVHAKKGGFELLGRDASRSIACDTPENRRTWGRMYYEGEFLPPRRAWLSESAAIGLAQKALNINDERRGSYIFKPRRYELGWLVGVETRGAERFLGADAEVGVGDDRKIKFVSRGL